MERQSLAAGRSCAVQLPEDQVIHRRVPDHAGLGDDCCDVRNAAADVHAADRVRQHDHGVDAVLKRHDERLRPHERRQQRRCRFDVVQLDCKEHGVDRTDRRGIGGRIHAMDVKIAFWTFETQAAGTHCVEVRAAREERDIGASCCESAAEVAAHAPGANDGDPHGNGDRTMMVATINTENAELTEINLILGLCELCIERESVLTARCG